VAEVAKILQLVKFTPVEPLAAFDFFSELQMKESISTIYRY